MFVCCVLLLRRACCGLAFRCALEPCTRLCLVVPRHLSLALAWWSAPAPGSWTRPRLHPSSRLSWCRPSMLRCVHRTITRVLLPSPLCWLHLRLRVRLCMRGSVRPWSSYWCPFSSFPSLVCLSFGDVLFMCGGSDSDSQQRARRRSGSSFCSDLICVSFTDDAYTSVGFVRALTWRSISGDHVSCIRAVLLAPFPASLAALSLTFVCFMPAFVCPLRSGAELLFLRSRALWLVALHSV